MFIYRSSQDGRTMIEILGVLALTAVLSISFIFAYSLAMEKIKINNTIKDITLTSQKIRNLYNTQKSFDNLDKEVFSLNLISGSYVSEKDQKLYHRLNGEVIIKPIASNTGFVMIYNGLTEKACITLASNNWGGKAVGLQFLVVSPTGVVPPRGFPSNLDAGEYAAEDLPLSPAEASLFCHCHNYYKCGIAWFYGI